VLVLLTGQNINLYFRVGIFAGAVVGLRQLHAQPHHLRGPPQENNSISLQAIIFHT
jgi:hypothetical protein